MPFILLHSHPSVAFEGGRVTECCLARARLCLLELQTEQTTLATRAPLGVSIFRAVFALWCLLGYPEAPVIGQLEAQCLLPTEFKITPRSSDREAAPTPAGQSCW